MKYKFIRFLIACGLILLWALAFNKVKYPIEDVFIYTGCLFAWLWGLEKIASLALMVYPTEEENKE